jgi:hypothetical protein
MTHGEAAAKLGWPIGMVKGRLSWARDILRSRLSRRGINASSAVLAVQLASTPTREPMSAALVQSTLKAAMAVSSAIGGTFASCSVVSVPVAVLAEGVLRAMALSQVKFFAVSVLVAAGVIAAGANVVAYQGFGQSEIKPAQDTTTGHVSQGSQTRKTTADDSIRADIEAARNQLDNLRNAYLSGLEALIIDPAAYHNWSLNLLVNETILASGAGPEKDALRAQAVKAHRDRLASLTKELTDLNQKGKITKNVVSAFESYLRRADRMLAEVKGAKDEASESGTGSASPSRSPTEGRSAEATRQPFSQASVAQSSQSQTGSAGMSAGGGNGFGRKGLMGGNPEGGFGGGGAAPDPRCEIARMAATLSTIDKNAKTRAVLKKLDEPASLHFPTETPLEAVLKHIRESVKLSDGKRIPIYVDPEPFQQSGKTMSVPVTMDLEEVPLKFSLRLLLKQVGLAYCVHDGVLIISSVEGIQRELEEAQSEQMGLNPAGFGMPAGMSVGGSGMM